MICQCDCHSNGAYGSCSIEGGCGHLHVERRCAQGVYCALKEPERDDRQRHTGRWLPAPIDHDRGLCPTCTRRTAQAVAALAEDALILTAMLGEPGGASEVLVSSSRDLPVPIRLSIEALRAEIDSELASWVEPVAEKLGADWDTTAMRRTRTLPRIARAARLLASAIDTLLALPEQEHPAWHDGEPAWDHDLDVQDTITRDGIAGAQALLDLHRRAYAATGRTHLLYRLPTPCPWCDHLALVRHNGSDHVECENCGKHIEEKYYDWFVQVLIREQQRAA